MGGTYEEMYSNWRYKMYAAAEAGNRHLAFMSLASAAGIVSGIRSKADVDRYDLLAGYYPRDLQKTAMAYDNFLREYRKEYDKAGIPEKHYSDIDEFVLAYQTNQ